MIKNVSQSSTRVIEVWNYKGFWLGTEHAGVCANIALEVTCRRWTARSEDQSISYVSKDWNFDQDQAIKFHKNFIEGRLINHRIDFSEWNGVSQKWRNSKRKK